MRCWLHISPSLSLLVTMAADLSTSGAGAGAGAGSESAPQRSRGYLAEASGRFSTKFMTLPHEGGEHRIMYHDWPAVGKSASEARTVVCVHGLTRNKDDFRKLGAQLSDNGFRYASCREQWLATTLSPRCSARWPGLSRLTS